MLSDLKFALRSLGKTPGFTAVAILTMAIAIGACSSLFTVLQAVVLRPLPFPHPDTLVSIWAINNERSLQAPALSWAKYEAYRTRTDVFSELSMSAGNGFTLTEGTGEPEQVAGLHASRNFLPVLGIAPIRGRQFTADEDKEGGPPVVMISERLWRGRFGADPDIIGRVLRIDGVAREVVAVLPALPVPFNGNDVIVPRPLELPYINPQQRQFAIVHQAYARLAPGVTLAQANLRIKEMAAQFKAANPAHIDSANDNEVRTISQQVLGDLGRTFWTLAGAVAAVLLIACANIANLFLARVSARQKEIAVRLSLGARRGEIIRQFLIESTVFTVAAGTLGVLLAWWSLHAIQVLAGPQIPRSDEIALDPVVLGFSLAVALGSGLLIGLYPAFQASRTDVQMVLKDTSRGAGGGVAAKAFRHLLVIAQVAMSLTLLICAGLLVLSFYKLQHTEPGFSSAHRAYGIVNLPSSKYDKPELMRDFYRHLQEKLRDAPELAHGAAITGLPLSGTGFFSPYGVQGRPVLPVQQRPLANIRIATPDYFATLEVKLLAGRFFNDRDLFAAEQVAIINSSFAKHLFPSESALDHFFLTGPKGDTPVRIVGVIGDVKSNGLSAPVPDEIYFPRDQRGGAFMAVVAEAKPGLKAAAVIPVLRRVLIDLDPTVALALPQTMDDLVTQSLGVQRVTLALLIAFAGIAALLAAVGVYSVMAYSVAQRTGEIGVRMALGASSGSILQLILRAGALQVGLGLAAGLAGAFGASRLLQQALYEVKPFDPAVFGAVALFFAAVAALACFIPARRAARVDPMVALRAE
ncbi:MAG TPA: ABC transporter permease [Lacunisphaera sp.]|jgi:predicted permease|nr:ABC transporter permease [Lacunisphaera sp.]